MANRLYKTFTLGDMEILYYLDDGNHIGMLMLPKDKSDRADFENKTPEPLAQIYIRGDALPGGFAAGLTMSQSETSNRFCFEEQTVTTEDNGICIRTVMKDARGYQLDHILTHRNGDRAVTVKTVFTNHSERACVLEDLSSFSIGMLTPFGDMEAVNRMKLYRARSWWSAEGRIESGTVSEYHLEQSWALNGVKVEKFFQTGSMPVRKYFPFAAVEDADAGVVWAVQLACPSSWQIEFRRNRENLCLTGGLADSDTGHWTKTVTPGDSFETPCAYLTAASDCFDSAVQRLLDLHRYSENFTAEGRLPILFNEYCASWGFPTEESLKKAVDALRGEGIDYFVIDAGWYCNGEWWNIGDWNVYEKNYPSGMAKTTEYIAKAGMRPGIWFELENCTGSSDVAKNRDMLLTRNGEVISSGRMFLDMKKPEVRAYLQKKVIDFLKDNHFRYMKVDYNDSIGMGCDDPDGLGEGLRKSLLATEDFFDDVHRQIPGISIECCSSGGHRLEPSMLNCTDVASFSDAHECVHIPIIAASLHRLMQPAKSQIWAVLRKEDSVRRLNYSLVNTLLGVMCLSGDVEALSEEQMNVVRRAVAFDKRYSFIINDGKSSFFGPVIESYAKPEGWQAVVRRNEVSGQTLVVIHTFGGEIPETITLPVTAGRIL
ncbi:MAG: alpha-galactosidase, partial [Clostridia bacterium]|nr:alpha-galactosidase [Clostridia bacterium]